MIADSLDDNTVLCMHSLTVKHRMVKAKGISMQCTSLRKARVQSSLDTGNEVA